MQADGRVEDEQPRLQPGDGLIEACAVGVEIEAQAGGGDHLDVKLGERNVGGGTNAIEAATDDGQRVFDGIEQDASGAALLACSLEGSVANFLSGRSEPRKSD
jgi:hypothetical protein